MWAEKSMYGKKYWGVVRATFIIDPRGKVAQVFPEGLAEDARRPGAWRARRARSRLRCQRSWTAELGPRDEHAVAGRERAPGVAAARLHLEVRVAEHVLDLRCGPQAKAMDLF